MTGRRGLGLLLLLLGTVGAGCATTKVKDVRMDPALAERGPVSNVLVVGTSPDPLLRREFEQSMADRLAQEGVQGTLSIDVMGGNNLPDRTQVENAFRQGNYDGVLVSNFAGVRTEVDPVPYGFYDYWGYGYGSYGFDVNEYVSVATRLYRTTPGGDEGMVWSARTETWDPGSSREVIDGATKAVVKQLEKNDLI